MQVPSVNTPAPTRSDLLMSKARELEATFLSEMLGHSGLGEVEGAFGGGQGAAQFASFLRQEQARLIVQGGGIGLAEMIFKAMTEVEDGAA